MRARDSTTQASCGFSKTNFSLGKLPIRARSMTVSTNPLSQSNCGEKRKRSCPLCELIRIEIENRTCTFFLLKGLVKCGWCKSHMTPVYSRNRHKKLYSYYQCTSKIHRGDMACAMKYVPAPALEQVIIDRLIQLGGDPERVQELVSDATTNHLEQMKVLEKTQKKLSASYRRD